MFDYYRYIFTTRQIIRSEIIFAVLCCILLTIACSNTETKTNTNTTITNPATDSSSIKNSSDTDKKIIENNFEHVTTISKTATSLDITAGTSNEIYAA